MTESRVRPMRADAVRNRAAILDAARGQITQHGPDVGMDQIATAAGVAVGTLYRHFPTKTDLVAAVVSAFVAEVADESEAALARSIPTGTGSPTSTAFTELSRLLRDIVLAMATNQAVKSAAQALDADVDDSHDVHRAHVAIQSLIEAARAEGGVRDDLSLADFYLLVSNAPDDQSPEVLHRWVDLTLFGIAGPAHPR